MAATSRRFMEGPLSKWTNVMNGWQYRWFVLDQSAGLLSYYTSKDKMKRGSRRGCFRLKRAIIGIDDEDDCTFTIRVDSRTYHFQAQDFQERESWVHALDSCIKRLHQPVRHLELTLPESRKGVTLDQRMAETEGYYQLLHEQVQSMSQSLNTTEEASQIRQTSKTMLEALRQCIDTMKDSLLMDGSELGSLEPSPAPPDLPQEESTLRVTATVEEGGKKGVRETASSTDSSDDSGSSTSGDIESDEEYFDADTELQSPSGVVVSPSVSVPLAEADPSDVEEEEEEKEANDTSSGVAANRSIIMHMMSQVRVGMDLTKIVLPTFILEKRSLLEMYADFLAHPDIFATIPDYTDPKERIIAIVRYYLSAFHAARKRTVPKKPYNPKKPRGIPLPILSPIPSLNGLGLRMGTVPKKPYNPILGETFQCYWDLPNARRTPPDENAKKILESGPVPYASYDSVTFVAEQVSHHPPISGFYAECPTKRMYVTGYAWTKSRFLGLSLGVHFIGKVHLHLLDYGEEYTVTLPNAYARSILTYPWMEMGGKCHLECAQTGYAADLEFHCKPFYGGKKHRVTANVYHETDKKPFLRVEGEWNGVMYTKHPNGDQEVFIDTLNTPTIRKKLKRLSAQDPGESRSRWQHVTEALRRQDIEAATEAKHMLEEKQRADARERQTLGVEWKQQLFHKEGEAWVYNSTLPQRLAELGTL